MIEKSIPDIIKKIERNNINSLQELKKYLNVSDIKMIPTESIVKSFENDYNDKRMILNAIDIQKQIKLETQKAEVYNMLSDISERLEDTLNENELDDLETLLEEFEKSIYSDKINDLKDKIKEIKERNRQETKFVGPEGKIEDPTEIKGLYR